MIRRCLPRRGNGKNTDEKNTNGKKYNIRFFTFDALQTATNNFSTLLGRGGYGNVYKGALPNDDDDYNGRRAVAIKKFTDHYEGFLEMVELMSHIRHINIIQVIGCCVEDGQHQLLVCEFAENGNVCEYLHSEEAPSLDWETRAAICLGTARGLSYLHQEISPRIVHRDIKPSNIVLDSNFVPKIADFDFIHCEKRNASQITEFANIGREYNNTCLTPKGTMPYMDPNYLSTGEVTEKADVYSFGIAMLEIITGRSPFSIVRWVTILMTDDALSKMVDPKLTDFPKEAVERFINVALLCTRLYEKQRPSMFEVVYMLYGGHKSDLEISKMATGAVDYQHRLWSSSSAYGDHTPVPMCSLSLTTSIEATDTSASASLGVHRAAEKEPREEPVDETAPAPAETRLASSSQEDQGCPEDTMKAYFERSMEKIMRYHVSTRRNITSDRTTIMTQTTVVNRSSKNMFKEAVYPPFLSGEYQRRPFQF